MSTILPGAEVQARGLRWQVVFSQELGPQTLYRLRGVEGALRGHELDLLHPLESITPIIHELQPQTAGPLRNWLVFHQAFLLEQSLGGDALLAVQPGLAWARRSRPVLCLQNWSPGALLTGS